MAEVVGIVSSIITVVELTGKVTRLTYKYIRGVKRASADMEALARELAELGEVLVTLKQYVDSNPSSEFGKLGGAQGPLRMCKRELGILNAKLEPREGRINQFLGKLIWPLKDSETQGHISEFERHKSLFTLIISVDQVTLTREIKTHIETTSELVEDVWVTAEDQKIWMQRENTRQLGETREKILNWIFAADIEKISETHRKTVEKRQKNTGKWLLGAPKFQQLVDKNPKSRLLWGYGIPGAGKTFLSSVVIDHFLKQQEEEDEVGRSVIEKHGVAYIYFEYKEREWQTPTHILSSLCKQLALQTPNLPTELEALYTKLAPKGKRPTIDMLYPVLDAIFELFGQVFLVFDGLDECDVENQRIGDSGLLNLFHRMVESGARLFVTSRPHLEDIRESFKTFERIKLSAKEEDVRAYIQQKINERPRVKRMIEQAKYQEKIIPDLVGFSKGMFLLARFHVEYICQQPTARKILNTVDNIRNSSTKVRPLDPTYDRAMETLHNQGEDSKELGLHVLTWLVNANRTLTVEEIRVAVCIKQDQYELDLLDLPEKETILEACAGLVFIDDTANTIELAHYTVQEYLLRKSIIPEVADLELAMACTTFLCFNSFTEGACKSNKSLEFRLKEHPFFEYAAPQLSHHLQACDSDLTADAVLKFLSDPGSVASYLQILHYIDKKRIDFNNYPKNRPPLHVAAILGHFSVFQSLLASSADLSAQDSHGWTALHSAAWKGNRAMAELLLEGGADILTQEQTGDTALHIAAEQGHEAVVSLLLEKNIDHSVREMHGWTALQLTAVSGHVGVLSILISAGADILEVDLDGDSALHKAVERGYEDVVTLLLQHGADLSVVNKEGETILHKAAIKGNERIIELLVEHGADIAIENKSNGYTALFLAAGQGHTAVVEFLLDKGADSYNSDLQERIVLFLPAQEGYTETMDLLLKKGASLTIRNDFGETVLHRAVDGGQEAVVKLLLKQGASVLAQDDDLLAPLHLAADKGHEVISKLLLESGASISVINSHGSTPLHLAAFKGHERVMRLLIEFGANLSVPENNGDSALHRAAYGHEAAAVKLLLEKGANVLARNNDGSTALCKVVMRGFRVESVLLVQLLLKYCADLSAHDSTGPTKLLHLAAYQGDVAVVELLLEKGAEISLENDNGDTALSLAALRGHEAVVRSLVKMGANISNQNHKGHTALYHAVSEGHELVVSLLLETTSRPIDTRSMLQAASSRGHHRVAHLLKSFLHEQPEH